MKKLLCAILPLLLAVGCAGSDSASTAAAQPTSEDLNDFYTADLQTLDYTIAHETSDQEVLRNLSEGLMEVNADNVYEPALAESYEVSSDGKTWTFHLRQNVFWVHADGEQGAALSAQDFVTGLHHAADFKAAGLSLVQTSIVGLAAYVSGSGSWDAVGIQAADDHTLVYTLTHAEPYFLTKTAEPILFPINQEFLVSQGDGCQLGAPDASSCHFGDASDPDSVLYDSAYLLVRNAVKSEQVLKKNPSYWDAEHVYICNVRRVYNDATKSSAAVDGFEQAGNYMATLLSSDDSFQADLEKYKDDAYSGLPNGVTYGIGFNLNRTAYDLTQKTAQQKEDTRQALLNTDFRLAIKYAFDRVSYLAAADPAAAAQAVRSTICPWVLIRTSDGTPYGRLVQNASSLATDMSEGQDACYSPAKAAEYMQQAAAQLQTAGVSFPVVLDLLTDQSNAVSAAQAAVLKQSLEENLAGYVRVEVYSAAQDVYQQASDCPNGSSDCDWDLSLAVGFNADYVDPKAYLDQFSIIDGQLITAAMGLSTVSTGSAANEAAVKACGLDQYQQLLDAADAQISDLDARDQAYAAAEAFLLDHALFLPIQTQFRAVSYQISRRVPFTGGYGEPVRYKGMIIQKEIVTAAQYQEVYQKWLAD